MQGIIQRIIIIQHSKSEQIRPSVLTDTNVFFLFIHRHHIIKVRKTIRFYVRKGVFYMLAVKSMDVREIGRASCRERV